MSELVTNVVSASDLARSAGAYLSGIVSGNPSSVLLLLSGGSAFELLPHIDLSGTDNQITVSMIDDRFYQDPHMNNYLQFLDTPFAALLDSKGASFVETVPDGDMGMTVFTDLWQETLAGWRDFNPNGQIIALLGVGADGHTAGIFPHPESKEHFDKLFENSDKLVVGYDAGDKVDYPKRTTVTNPFLRDYVDQAIVYVRGTDKKDALKKINAKEGSLHETPARILNEMKKVALFTDQEI